MTGDKGTIRIPRDKFDHHNERRKELGLTWAEYIDGEEPDAPAGVDTSEVAEEVVDQLTGGETSLACQFGDVDIPEGGFEDFADALERIEASTETVEERTGRIERTLDELTGQR